jgi:hypothetical protein
MIYVDVMGEALLMLVTENEKINDTRNRIKLRLDWSLT